MIPEPESPKLPHSRIILSISIDLDFLNHNPKKSEASVMNMPLKTLLATLVAVRYGA